MKHKLLTLLLAMIASTSMLFAASGTCGDNLTWDLTNGVLTISGTGVMSDYRLLTHSSSLEGDEYFTTDAPWCGKIMQIVISNGVTSIGRDAFAGCTGLTSITIPNSITSIGREAFAGCTVLTSITIPNSVTSIGSKAFYGCKGLTSITIPNSVASIGNNAFSNCTKLTRLNISDIAAWCAINFASSSSNPLSYIQDLYVNDVLITDLIIPYGVTKIGNYAFYGCSGLTSVTIPSSVTSFGDNAFYNCSKLTKINISDIAAWCAINFASSGSNPISYIQNLYVNDELITDLVIPDGVTKIGNYAFYGYNRLTSVTISSSVTSIGNNAFSNCTNLLSVTINGNISNMGNNVFLGCSNLNKVYWNVLNADISESLFPANLDSLIIGENVEEVGFTSQPQYYFTFRSPITRVRLHAAPKLASFYDYNHDGVMEFVDTVKYKSNGSNNYNVRFKNLLGFYDSDNLLDGAYPDLQTINLNNDTLVDFINGFTLYQANSNGAYDKMELDYTKSENTDHLFALDADLNGTTDFYSNEGGTHYLHLRQFDGSYQKIKMNVISETAEVDSAIYAKWDKPKTGIDAIIIVEDHFPSLKEDMFLPNVSNSDDFKTIDVAVDLDKNGLVDLLSTSTGAVLYNLGNNKYLRGRFPGAVTIKDMNNDGIEDFVIYDESTKTVSLQIYSNEGSYQTITLMQNMNISNVWCFDFDNDGDVDILLPFDWTSTSGYAYLVFFRNDGNNTFKKVETAFDDPIKHFQFLECRDVDNDNKYEIIARDSLYGSNSIVKGNYYLIRYNNRMKATMDATPLVSNTLANSTNNFPFIYGDFDNDGNNDCYYYCRQNIKNNQYDNYVVLSHFANTKINTAPQKMSAPQIVEDAASGKLLVSWNQGNDAETPDIDLAYSLRIGSAPGSGDMWYASALNDGRQTSLNAANIGSRLSQIVNVSGWKSGDYYICVQAIDPNGLGGQWSDEVVYHHSLPSATFNTNTTELTTADTLFVQYAGMVDNTVSYIWNFGDSATILSSDEQRQVYEIVYNTAGIKTISLQLATTDGRTSGIYSVELTVYPMKLEKEIDYYPGLNYMSYFDMDMDGQMDALGYYSINTTQQGFFKGKSDGSFVKLAKTYNSDLTINNRSYLRDSCIFADFNMDGLPDVQWSTNKGTVMYNMEDFDVEFSNETFTLPYTEEKYDFNGDGIDDEVKIKNSYALAIILNGEMKDTIELDLPNGYTLQRDHSWGQRNPHVQDVNNDGFLDFIVIQDPNISYDRSPYIIYLNEDWSFYCQDIPQEYDNDFYGLLLGYPFVDLNNDGTPDFRAGYFMKSRISNEVPSVPTNLRVVQENEGVFLYWDAAKDKETPATRMRYNISVKKQGVAVGTDNAFIVSPMNGLYDEANIVPGHVYPHGTSYFIPIDKFAGGQTYEFQIQSIDLWNAHSPMSAAYTFTVQPQVLISMPANTCINEPVTVAYIGTNNGAISWNFNGGTASQNSDGTYSVSWSTEGIKTVTATIGGKTSSRVIYVQNAEKDLTFSLPERVLNNSWVDVTLPENYLNLENLAIRTSDNCTGYILPKKDSHIFRVRFSGTSPNDSEIGWIEFYQNNLVCGEVNTFRDSTTIVGNGNAPAISLVMVDATTGKNMVTWDAPANLPAYVDSVIVYKEEGKTNNWVKQAKLPVSIGQWIDNASDPSVKSNSYCIAYTSIYGGESPKSKPHKTPHLQTNYGLNGTINLYWTSYEGDVVDSYQIMRGSSASSLQVLATVAGNECTYTDNSPLEDGYYAIAYSNEAFTEEWISDGGAANAPAHKAMAQARQIRTGQSNIKSSASSIRATLAQSLNILSMERTYTLSPAKTTLHLYAEFTPMQATYKQVNWTIVSGTELASINSNGLVVANTAGLNGTVTVRATAIDGSGVYAERDITVGGMVVYYTIRFINWNGEVLQSSQVVGGDMPTYNGATPVRAGEGQYVFSFRGWSPDIVIATADADYIAQYDTTAYYTIRFLNWDGTVLQSGLLKEGSIPAYNGETPTREENETYTYTFKEWEPSIAAVTTNADYTAQYDSVAIQYYTIRFLNWDGTVLQSERLREGTYPEYKGETPTRADDEYYTYTFRAWSPWPTVVTKDADYTAIYYDTMIPHFTIRFLDWNGDVLQRDRLKEGVMPIYRGETPIHEENDYYTYTFKGWEPEIVAVTTDADYIAQYDSVAIPYYTIRFLNWDGTVLQSESLKIGTTPEYKGETPIHGEEGYYFSRWSPTIVAATANADYIAIYKTCEDLHAIWLQTGEGSGGYGNLGEMEKDSYKWTFDIYRGAYISGSGYDFLRTPAKDLTNMTSITLSFSHLYSDVNNPSYDLSLWVCANYQNNDDDIWQELTIPSYGNWKYVDVIIDVPDNYVGKNTVFGFQYDTEDTDARWQIKDLQLDAECIESTSPDPTYYTIRFLNWDGEVLQSSQVEEGSTPSYEGSTPIRPDDEQYTYSFSGWTPTIAAATADADYIAQYTATAKNIGGCQDIHDLWLVTGSNDFGEITTNNAEVWTWDSRYGAVASKSGGITSWLLTPQRDLMGKENITLSFSHVHRYAVDFESEMTLWVSAEYQGSVEASSWQQLPISPYASNTSWTYVAVTIDVPEDKVGEHTVFGFKYTSTASNYAKWEIENLHLDAQCTEVTTNIDNTSFQKRDVVRKILINGQIFILRGDKTYTLTGAEVK